MRASAVDSTLPLLLEGYGWLPNQRRRTGRDAVPLRLAGQPAVALCGPDAARFFYDERHVRRAGAVPGPVQRTLFGRGAVHTLDGPVHRRRKSIFVGLGTPEAVRGLTDEVTAAWDRAVGAWAGRHVVLFDEASRVLAGAVCRWAGVAPGSGAAPTAAAADPVAAAAGSPVAAYQDAVASLAADLVAMVDGFATPSLAHWRARRARRRREAWLGALVTRLRDGAATAPPGSVLDTVARHVDAEGRPLSARAAAVELLNVLRPTTAVCWFVSFAAHALHRWPAHRARLAAGDPAFARAFTHEVRRFYPFAPFVGGRAVRDLRWQGTPIPADALVLLDVYGQNHDARLWAEPYTFAPERFLGREIDPFTLIPQGGGDPAAGHRCPGESATVGLLAALSQRLAALSYRLPPQDLAIPLHRIPTRPRSGVVLTDVSAP
ncbi:MAG TPA: cytochrome P450 [Pilimelia sp.]|nr:cytochrome P450 [Pilimelia sp.]